MATEPAPRAGPNTGKSSTRASGQPRPGTDLATTIRIRDFATRRLGYSRSWPFGCTNWSRAFNRRGIGMAGRMAS
jgi:hypothetical protein